MSKVSIIPEIAQEPCDLTSPIGQIFRLFSDNIVYLLWVMMGVTLILGGLKTLSHKEQNKRDKAWKKFVVGIGFIGSIPFVPVITRLFTKLFINY